MAYTNSKLVAHTKLSPNHSGQRTHSIDRISPHCVVGQVTAESLGNLFARASYQASSNYGIDKDGRVGLYVEEKNRSWCTSSSANDQRAVTIECASDTSSPYRMNDAVYQTLIKLCADICRRKGKKKLLWFGDKNKTLNYSPASDEMVITVHRWFANKSCLPVDSEVLTRDGWVSLRNIQIGDEIACADLENLRITFEEVYDKVPERDQDTYTNNGFTATMDHRCVYRCQSQSQFRIEDYRHLLSAGQMIYIPVAGYMENEGMDISDDELRLMTAVQADGHYMHELRSKGDSRIGLEFHLKKVRKIERIKDLLLSCGFEFRENHKADGSVSIRVWGKEIVDECEKYLTDKCFDWRWISMSKHQAEVFLNEILLWDGCQSADLYSSKQQINLDVISAIAGLNGVGSKVTGSNIQFRRSPFITLGKEKGSTKRNNKQHGTEKTRVSCVSVKTGIFLVRQNGKTFLTGNCPGDWLYSRLGDLANKVTAELGGNAAPIETEVMLGKGDRGNAVEEMQKMLIACGYSCGSCGADGIFGNDTLKALEAFQKASGLAVDGIYGPKSKAALTAQYQNKGKTGTKPYTEAFIEKVAPLAQADQKANGILASVTIAQAILESGWGRSELAVNANNLFGMKKSLSGNTWTGSTWDGKSVYSKETKEVYASGPATVQDDFRAYKSWQESVGDHSAYLLGAKNGNVLRYEGLKGCTDYRKAAQIIKDGGYATSPTYVEKLCSIIEEWKLTQYDTATTPVKVEEKASTAMAITIYVPGFSTSKSDERHGDGMVIHSESGQTLVIDGFDGGAPTTSLISYLKKHNYKDLHLMLSHPHYDHYKGLRMIMADSFFNIKVFYCYDPASIKHGIGSSANGRSVKDDYDNLNACISQAKGRGASINYLDTGRYVVIGDIEFKVWRKQPTHFTDLDDGNAYAFTNDGSLCCYFSKLRFLTTGDGPTDLKEAIAYFGDKVYVLKVPHHGNSCSKSNAQAARNAGCVIAFETNIESKGPGTTDFTAYGARRLIEQGVKVLMQNKDIIMTASGGKLTVRQGGSTWTFDVPYDGKPAQLYRVRKSWSNVNSQIGAYSILANAKAAADKAGSAYGVFDWNGKEVYRASGVKDPYLVRVTKVMDIRKGPGTSHGKAERKCPAGIFTIVEVKGDWGRLKSGAGWIQLSKTEKI